MSAQSMTGFGEASASSDNYIISIEIKSVNNRFKDIRFKMPNGLNNLEMELKKELNDLFARGTFDVFINVKRPPDKNRFDDLDPLKISQFVSKLIPILKNNGLTPAVNVVDFLRAEFLLDPNENEQNELNEIILKTFKLALKQLIISREEEGAKLIKVLKKHLENYRTHFLIIVSNADQFLINTEEKLKKRVEDYKGKIEVEQSRLLQEIIFYLEKIDIQEEINRVQTHLDKCQNLLSSSQEVGRQIDFIIQELNRETNTIGSKSSIKEISEAVIQMKMQLEKMREQGQNIE